MNKDDKILLINSHCPVLSIVIPCFNEERVLPELGKRLLAILSKIELPWEVILVDDGSRDDTLSHLHDMHASDMRFKVISFSRNFGHQTAIFAGLAHAYGDIVAVMDADLQDPPEFLETCIAKLNEGFDVVYAVRRNRKENILKRTCYSGFYRLLKIIADVEIPLDSGDFCLMRQNVVSVMRSMPERDVFVRGLRAWSGFRQCGIEYNRDARAAGETKYSIRKLVQLALDGVFSFSAFPLRLATYLGFFSLTISIILAIFIITWKTFNLRIFGYNPSTVAGWTSIICLMLFIASVQFLILGIIGEFISRIYSEAKQRPRWIIQEMRGFDIAQ